jgi:transcriptional regulator with XRE-family HTH domain
VQRQTINRYERGRIIPTPDTLRWLAAALCLPTVELVAAAQTQRAIVQAKGGLQSSGPDSLAGPVDVTSASSILWISRMP